jgi:phage baseplate assembly protein W
MGTFNFKSSGTTYQTTPANQLVVTPLPVGIVTPLSLGNTDLLTTNTDMGVQMSDNFRNLLQTNWGERLGLYDYGANLKPLLVDFVSPDNFDAQATSRIRSAVQRWMPYIVLEDFTSSFDRVGKLTSGMAQVTITITYNIPSLGVTGKKIKVTLYAI